MGNREALRTQKLLVDVDAAYDLDGSGYAAVVIVSNVGGKPLALKFLKGVPKGQPLAIPDVLGVSPLVG